MRIKTAMLALVTLAASAPIAWMGVRLLTLPG